MRNYPGERIVVVEVSPNDFEKAVGIASELDDQLEDGFVTVKKSKQEKRSGDKQRTISALSDSRITDLIQLLNARSRTSESQPSLHYVKDAAENVSVTISPRHHIIFGRRGVGKTALMLEAKRVVQEKGDIAFWMNIQTVRSLDADNAFLTVAKRISGIPIEHFAWRSSKPQSVLAAEGLRIKIDELLSAGRKTGRLDSLVPQIQEMLGVFCEESQVSIYLFLDDIHYINTANLPTFLDRIHGVTRDKPIWIKAAGIKHQSRWFTDNPPTGLQTGHDAAIIDLDITLEEPEKAKSFLTDILATYNKETKISSTGSFISATSLDRLVLASGGVPRDFLLLCASSIQVARQRQKARYVGVQDVNEAAGKAAKLKIQELEEDAASSIGSAESRIKALDVIRRFLLDSEQITFFRVDFRDKEEHQNEYAILQSLMDLRIIHLVNGSLSDKREAGRRSEVYLLDLSEYSSQRLKHNLRVLDFEKRYLVLKSTGSSEAPRKGDTPTRHIGILRLAPVFDLEKLADLIA